MFLLLFILFFINTNLFSNLNNFLNKIEDNLAIITVPVADAVNSPVQLLCYTKDINNIYKNLPFAPEKGRYSCIRSHQFLLHEPIIIKQVLNNEVECEACNVVYLENNIIKKTFWILKNNIKNLSDLKNQNIDLNKIPDLYRNKKNSNQILTLFIPHYDSTTKATYSAGTKFVRNIAKDTNCQYGVYVFDIDSFQIKEILIPKSNAIVNYPKNKKQFRSLFMDILRKWTNQKDLIPYVWGGASFTSSMSENNFSFKTDRKFGENVSYWSRPCIDEICTGLDCSGLIFRICQICDVPFYLRNTKTIIYYMSDLKFDQELAEGDLIVYSGHILIVSDLKNNKIIEAVGYKSGFGKLHEIEIKKVFQNINNFSDLIFAYKNNQQIKRLDILDRSVRSINKFYILKLDYIWEYKNIS